MQWLTRSMPMPRCRPVAMATFTLVPTESVLDTSTGRFQRVTSSSKRPLNAPMPPSTAEVWVLATALRIRSTARFPASMSTPASA